MSKRNRSDKQRKRNAQRKKEKVKRRLGLGDKFGDKFGDGFAYFDEGYSPEELAEQLSDPHSRVRRTIDDLSISAAMGINDPALANWTYALAALANVQDRCDELEFPAKNLGAIKRMARQLGAARVIDIPGNVYGEIFHNVDVYTCEEIGGDKWIPPLAPRPRGPERDAMNEHNLEITKTIMAAHERLAYPDHLPFESTYFAFTSPAPVLLNDSASYVYRMAKLDATDRRMGHEVDDTPCVMRILGYLVCENGIASEFIELTRRDNNASDPGRTLNAVVPFEVHWPNENTGPRLGVDGPVVPNLDEEVGGGWSNLFLLNGWVIRALVDLINNYRSIHITEHDLPYLEKREVRRNMRKHGVVAIPRPFYRMRLQTKVTHKAWQETVKQLDREKRKTQSQTYRHDVRGHERVHVERGSKPIDPTLQDKLAARDFRIYFDAVDAGDLIRISARGVRAKASDEWIAIRNTFVKAHVSPRDESLPYVPSIHEVPPSKPGEQQCVDKLG